jgi:hypothetical protein
MLEYSYSRKAWKQKKQRVWHLTWWCICCVLGLCDDCTQERMYHFLHCTTLLSVCSRQEVLKEKLCLLIYDTQFTFWIKIEFSDTKETCNYFTTRNEELQWPRFIPDLEKYQNNRKFANYPVISTLYLLKKVGFVLTLNLHERVCLSLRLPA